MQCRFLSVDLEDLERELVQVEWMTDLCPINEVPHLQLADVHRLVAMVSSSLLTKSNPLRRLILKPNVMIPVILGVPVTSGSSSRSRGGMCAAGAFRRPMRIVPKHQRDGVSMAS